MRAEQRPPVDDVRCGGTGRTGKLIEEGTLRVADFAREALEDTVLTFVRLLPRRIEFRDAGVLLVAEFRRRAEADRLFGAGTRDVEHAASVGRFGIRSRPERVPCGFVGGRVHGHRAQLVRRAAVQREEVVDPGGALPVFLRRRGKRLQYARGDDVRGTWGGRVFGDAPAGREQACPQKSAGRDMTDLQTVWSVDAAPRAGNFSGSSLTNRSEGSSTSAPLS